MTKPLVFATFGHALSIHGRDAAKIQSDLNNVDKDIQGTKSLVRFVSVGGLALDPAGYDYIKQLPVSVKSCATDATNVGTVSWTQAQSICNFVSGPLLEDTQALLDTILTSSPTKAGVFVTNLEKYIENFRAETAACLDDIVALKTSCSSAPKNADQIFASAIAAVGK